MTLHDNELTHWGRDKMAAISERTFSNAFSWMKMYEFQLKFHQSLFLRVQLTIFHHWFRYWLGAGQATSHYLKQWWLIKWRIYASLGLNELSKVILSIRVVFFLESTDSLNQIWIKRAMSLGAFNLMSISYSTFITIQKSYFEDLQQNLIPW